MCVSTLRTRRPIWITDIEAVNEPAWVRKARRELRDYRRKLWGLISPEEQSDLRIKINALRSRLESGGYELTRER